MATHEAAGRRTSSLAGHLHPRTAVARAACSAAGAPAAPDDVVIVSALRTPICKAKRGGLATTPADDLVCAVLKATTERTGVDPKDIGDVVVGSVLGNSSQRANECRIAMFLAGYPKEVPVRTVNRQCSSGLQACADVAASIKAGYYTIGIGAGVESMSTNPMKWEGGVNPRVAESQDAQNCLVPMGMTSENVAAAYGITREKQDAMAMRSHQRAAAARAAGRFRDEIVPVHTKVKDPKTGQTHQITVFDDDGIREGISMDILAKLPAVFKKGGSTTPGNASQVSDGAGAVLMMTRAEAQKRGLPIMGVWRSFAAVGCDPAVMGIGPAVAIPVATEMAGLTPKDIDVYELNEAFASQATYSVEKLGLDVAKVNPNGGAIALGHPLGATGARAMATLLHEMKRRGSAAKYGVVSMCIGSGMGAAAVIEAP